jgi:hypothetical protein
MRLICSHGNRSFFIVEKKEIIFRSKILNLSFYQRVPGKKSVHFSKLVKQCTMKESEILDNILAILHSVKEDKAELQKILDFLMDEVYKEQEDETIIPEKYQKLVHQIAGSISGGLICYLNPETLEVEAVFKDLHEFELDADDKNKVFKHESWKKCITIEPPESSASFKIMEKFTNEVDDIKLQNRLIYALNHKRPYANFKNIIENSFWRERWFALKGMNSKNMCGMKYGPNIISKNDGCVTFKKNTPTVLKKKSEKDFTFFLSLFIPFFMTEL